MGKVIFDMSMSLDGFVRATGTTPEEPLGKGGERLHEWAMGGDTAGGELLAAAKDLETGRSKPRPQVRKGEAVSATVLYMSMSLDGFVAGPNDEPGTLHDWLSGGEPSSASGVPSRLSGVNGQILDELMATGAVVAGRGTFEPAGGWGGDHHDGVPIFVLSRQKPGIETGQWPLVTYVSDLETAITEARQAAGDKNVLVHGAGTAQLALAAGVLDELEIHLIPVLLGQGRRLFDRLGPEHIDLERTRILEGEDGVTHLHYRVQR
jgi:dihydrofolate reductase